MKRVETKVVLRGSTHGDLRSLNIDDVPSGMRLLDLDIPAEGLLRTLMYRTKKDPREVAVRASGHGAMESLLPVVLDAEEYTTMYERHGNREAFLRFDRGGPNEVVMTVSTKDHPEGILSIVVGTRSAAIALLCTLFHDVQHAATALQVDPRIGVRCLERGSFQAKSEKSVVEGRAFPEALQGLRAEGRLTFQTKWTRDRVLQVDWQAWAEPVGFPGA